MDILAYPLGFIMNFVYSMVNNYGMSIILFTVIIKVALFPLAIKQQKSSAVMIIMQPKVKAIQKKHKDDRVKAQEEMMALYKDNNVNQFAGCLPALIQMPIMFGLINVIYNPLTHILRIPKETIAEAVKLISGDPYRAESAIKAAIDLDPSKFTMFSAEQISQIQHMNITFLGLNLTDVPYVGLTVLMLIPLISASTMILSMYISMKISGSLDTSQGKAMLPMMAMSSIMSLGFGFSVPIGVSLYWISSSVIQCLQSILLNKLYNKDDIKRKIEAQMKSRDIEFKQNKKEKKKLLILEEEVNDNDDVAKENKKQKEVSEKEYYKIRLEKARQMDSEFYGDESNKTEETKLKENTTEIVNETEIVEDKKELGIKEENKKIIEDGTEK